MDNLYFENSPLYLTTIICGLIASVLIAVFAIPQLISCLKNKTTCACINIPLYLTCIIWQACFLAAGIIIFVKHENDYLLRSLPLIISQITGVTISLILVIMRFKIGNSNNLTPVIPVIKKPVISSVAKKKTRL